MCDADEAAVPAWPVKGGRVEFTCLCCKKPSQVLVEGCEPGLVADIACENRQCKACGDRECRYVSRVQIRRAMFS